MIFASEVVAPLEIATLRRILGAVFHGACGGDWSNESAEQKLVCAAILELFVKYAASEFGWPVKAPQDTVLSRPRSIRQK